MEKKVSERIATAFGKRIVCLLYYGSNAFPQKSRSKLSDYDFCLVLDRYKEKDISKLKEITKDYNGIDLTLHYVEDLDELGWNNFQHGNHGVFFLLHLASARTLLGVNVFSRKIPYINRQNVIDSLERQIIEYFWRLNHWYLSELDESKLAVRYKKYLIRIAQDILVAKGDISFSEINVINNRKLIEDFVCSQSYFSTKTKKYFLELLKERPLKPPFRVLNRLRETLYRDFRKAFTE